MVVSIVVLWMALGVFFSLCLFFLFFSRFVFFLFSFFFLFFFVCCC